MSALRAHKHGRSTISYEIVEAFLQIVSLLFGAFCSLAPIFDFAIM
jgi:hypothetical protein